jgi:serpin B
MEVDMKKILISMIFISLLAMSACNVISDNDETDVEEGYVKSNLARETSPQVDSSQIEALVDGNTDFALSFYDQIRKDDENIIFSPISLSLALSMALTGAEEDTKAEMIEALKLSLSENEVHPAYNALLLAIEASEEAAQEGNEGTNFQLNIANSIWGQAGYDFREEFLDTLARNYGAGVYNVDYINNPEAARNAINKWVEEETEEKIKNLIPPGAIDALTRMVLANAIYFNGSWLHPFEESATEEAPFTLLDGSVVNVDMMSLTGQSFNYGQGENYQAIQIPYLSQDFSMTLLVPDAGSFEEFEDELSSENLDSILNNLVFQPVDLSMPKFDFESTLNGKDPLQSLGMAEAFDPDAADYSGITEVEKLYISEVLHKATITVDEEGTEAAAATAVIFATKSAMPEEPIALVIDRPFLFLIQHQPTGTILFMGHVLQP